MAGQVASMMAMACVAAAEDNGPLGQRARPGPEEGDNERSGWELAAVGEAEGSWHLGPASLGSREVGGKTVCGSREVRSGAARIAAAAAAAAAVAGAAEAEEDRLWIVRSEIAGGVVSIVPWPPVPGGAAGGAVSRAVDGDLGRPEGTHGEIAAVPTFCGK